MVKKLNKFFISISNGSEIFKYIDEGFAKDYINHFSIFMIYLNFYSYIEENNSKKEMIKFAINDFIMFFNKNIDNKKSEAFKPLIMKLKKIVNSGTNIKNSGGKIKNPGAILKNLNKSFFDRNCYLPIKNSIIKLFESIIPICEMISLIYKSLLFKIITTQENKKELTFSDVVGTSISKYNPPIPFISSPSVKKYTLVLDLDETLIHSITVRIINYNY
jgi:hypothetical protein